MSTRPMKKRPPKMEKPMGSNVIDGLTQAMHEAREELQQTQDELNVQRRTSGILRRQRDELAKYAEQQHRDGQCYPDCLCNHCESVRAILAEIGGEKATNQGICVVCGNVAASWKSAEGGSWYCGNCVENITPEPSMEETKG